MGAKWGREGPLDAQWGREGPLGGKGWGGLHGHLVGVVGVAHRTLKFTSCVPTVPRRCFHFQKEWGMWGWARPGKGFGEGERGVGMAEER